MNPSGPKQTTILLAEDHEELRYALATHLRHEGYHVIEALHGLDALHRGRDYFGWIDVLLTDLKMPYLTGKSVADALRVQRPYLPVLFLTGEPIESVSDSLGPMTAYLRKPYELADVLVKVRELLTVKTILLLEDEPFLMELMRHMLKQYNVIECSTAEQALRLFSAHGRQVDLLVADVTLPASSGIEVALLLRSHLPNLPVILTSGNPVGNWSVRNTSNLERLGSSLLTILQKPFQAQGLLTAVRESLRNSAV